MVILTVIEILLPLLMHDSTYARCSLIVDGLAHLSSGFWLVAGCWLLLIADG